MKVRKRERESEIEVELRTVMSLRTHSHISGLSLELVFHDSATADNKRKTFDPKS